MRKAYVAILELEVLFTADEDQDNLEEEALKAVTANLRDNPIGCMSPGDVDHHVASYMPGGWSDEDLVYGTHNGDMTAREALEATPEYVEAKERRLREAAKHQQQGLG